MGVPQGEGVRGKAMATVIVVSGSDGYRVVLTLPEIDPAFREEKVLLADSEDGHPPDAREGPFRLIQAASPLGARGNVPGSDLHTLNPSRLSGAPAG